MVAQIRSPTGLTSIRRTFTRHRQADVDAMMPSLVFTPRMLVGENWPPHRRARAIVKRKRCSGYGADAALDLRRRLARRESEACMEPRTMRLMYRRT